MNRISPLEADTSRKSILGEVVGYLIVTAAGVRGLVGYPDVRLQIIGLLTLFVLLLLAEPVLRRQRGWGQPLYILGQVAIMVALFFLTPQGDFWAIMLLPACSYVMRRFRQQTAWIWIGFFIVAMSAMIIIGETVVFALEFIVVYVAAYLLIGSYALLLNQMEAAQEESLSLLRQLQQTNAQLEEYVVQVEELTAIKERNRLARELHDAVTQTIFSMTLIARSALILQERDPGQVKDKLLQLQELAQGALQEMRSLIQQLRTFSVAEDGLYPVLQKFVDGVSERNDLKISLDPAPDLPSLTPVQQQEVYRIIQEAVNNVVKHARANSVVIRLTETNAAFIVTVADNGVGFDPAQTNHERAHIGLGSMRERAEELGGTLEIAARPGAGTEVRVAIPLATEGMSDE
jgi:signal transduction histidine kinase